MTIPMDIFIHIKPSGVIQKDLMRIIRNVFNEYSAKTSTLRMENTYGWLEWYAFNGSNWITQNQSIVLMQASNYLSSDTYIHIRQILWICLGYIVGRLLKSKSLYSGFYLKWGDGRVGWDNHRNRYVRFQVRPAGWADINYILADHGAKRHSGHLQKERD